MEERPNPIDLTEDQLKEQIYITGKDFWARVSGPEKFYLFNNLLNQKKIEANNLTQEKMASNNLDIANKGLRTATIAITISVIACLLTIFQIIVQFMHKI